MKVLIAGANGQAGRELQQTAPPGIEIIAAGSDRLDVTEAVSVHDFVNDRRPQLIINAAAYTAVDKAESNRETAYAVNTEGAANLACAAQRFGARVIHISTDFVFDGEKSSPYLPADAPAPLGVYGASKLEGEHRVMAETRGGALVIRTAWLYAAKGNNFVNTMLRLMAEKDALGVVADQVGTPTWARTLAEAIWRAAARPNLTGVYHWTDAGVASWYDFAIAIRDEAIAAGLLNRETQVNSITSAKYPTPARRPAYSVLDKTTTWNDFGLAPRHWRQALREMMQEKTHA